MNIIQFDHLPNDKTTFDEIQICQFIVKYKIFPNDYILDDLWHIVFSFFYGFTDLFISIPLKDLLSTDNMRPDRPNTYFMSFAPLVSHFYGYEDQGELYFINNALDMRITVSGHYPSAVVDFCMPILEIIKEEILIADVWFG